VAETTKPGRAGSVAKKILVVDDEPHMVRLLQVVLEKVGYEVVSAVSANDGLEKVNAENPDLVILDIEMPDMDVHNIRKNSATRELPVILMLEKRSNRTVFPGWQKGWQSGGDYYIAKPFNPMELISFINRIFSAQDGRELNGNEANAEILTLPPESLAQILGPPAPTQPSSDAPVQPVSWWIKIIKRLFA
jgi:two-component system alkaline phosphatase synthesis response regulator PhoP